MHIIICRDASEYHIYQLQVHLICMPPSGDITCKKSSQYHFVNEYLYKPLNLDEAESKPNVTLRYSERYFPSDIYTDERENDEYRSHHAPQRRPVSHELLYIKKFLLALIGFLRMVMRSVSLSLRDRILIESLNYLSLTPIDLHCPAADPDDQQSAERRSTSALAFDTPVPCPDKPGLP